MSAPAQSRIPFAQFRDRVVAISLDVVTSKLQNIRSKVVGSFALVLVDCTSP